MFLVPRFAAQLSLPPQGKVGMGVGLQRQAGAAQSA
jgi:hypothetical protein